VIDLYYGYLEHVELLMERKRNNPQEALEIDKNIADAYKRFFNATHNEMLTRRIFEDYQPSL
ncbi:MAG TPA: hypothetical protein VJZ91_08425, partial [Blastocatellia bacterium]|nr:hypothetical protein [Blastocatellia bacterium]